MESAKEYSDRKKVLLMMLPFWDPLIPPQGIACLKSYLQKYGYTVKTVDANVERGLKELYNRYFDVLKKYVPEERRGNFFNIGHDVLQNHMMAHINSRDEEAYVKLVKILIHKTFFTDVDHGGIGELNKILEEFYSRLAAFCDRLLNTEKPGVLGLTVNKGNLPASLFAFKRAREKCPGIMTVMGGGVFSDHLVIGSPNFEFFLQETEDYVDKIVVGQGEILFRKLLEGELPGSQRVFTLADLGGKGLDFRDMDIADLSDFDLRYYPYVAATGSSSCPNQCTFCNVAKFWGGFKKKDVKQAAEEMIESYRRYGIQLFFMTDSQLNPIITDLAGILIEAEVSVYWDAYLCVDETVCDIENTLLWRRGGFYRTRIGVESGSQRVLDMMGKKITPQQSGAALASLAEAGVKTTAYWVIGHPGETEEDFLQTLDLLEELKDNIWEAECNPFGYYFLGQSNADKWRDRSVLLYPEEAGDLLIARTWIVDDKPSREETYRRMWRFMAHCKKLGIPNPYSVHEIAAADERWKRLHPNAAPSLLSFEERGVPINECREVKRLCVLQNSLRDDEGFCF